MWDQKSKENSVLFVNSVSKGLVSFSKTENMEDLQDQDTPREPAVSQSRRYIPISDDYPNFKAILKPLQGRTIDWCRGCDTPRISVAIVVWSTFFFFAFFFYISLSNYNRFHNVIFTTSVPSYDQ